MLKNKWVILKLHIKNILSILEKAGEDRSSYMYVHAGVKLKKTYQHGDDAVAYELADLIPNYMIWKADMR